MSHTQVQWARGATANVASYTGPIGELVLNTDDWSLQAQDGVTAGGWLVRPRRNVRVVAGTGAQSVNLTDDIVAWQPGAPAATTFTLPSSPRLGEVHEFQYLASSGSFALTIAPPAGQTIDGASSIALSALYGTASVVYIGANQWITLCPPASEIPGLAPSATTDTTNAANISSGTLAAARGGAGSVNGALKGNGSGAVAQAAVADLSDALAPTSWTPTDQSGAGLSLTVNSASYLKLGKLVFCSLSVTYPSTANTSNATLSLPLTSAALINSPQLGYLYANGGAAYQIASGTAKFSLANLAFNTTMTNAALSGQLVEGTIAFIAA